MSATDFQKRNAQHPKPPSSLGARARLFLCALIAVCSGSTVFAQSGSVELTVLDENGKKLRDVTVRAMAEGSKDVVTEVTTNKKGIAKAEFSSPGFYDLELAKDGFPTQPGRVEVREGMTTSASMTLYSEARWTAQQAVNAFNEGVKLVQTPGQEDLALAEFQRAAEIDPSLADAHRLVAIIAAQKGDLATAGPALQKFVGLAPERAAEAASAAHYVFRQTGRFSEMGPVRQALVAQGIAADVAITVFNDGVKVLNQGEEDPSLKDEKTEAAKQFFQESLELDPQLAVAHRSLAALEFNEAKYEAALPHLDRLLALTPDHRDGNRMAFFSNAELGNREEAIAKGKAWAGKDSYAVEEIAAKGAEFYEANDSSKARLFAELAVAVDDGSGYAHYTLGRVLAGAGEVAKAKTHLQRFVDLAPDHPEANAAKQMLAGL